MAAETLTGTRAGNRFPAQVPLGTGLGVAFGNYAVGAAIEDGDIWKLCKVPKGAILMGGWAMSTDGDTGTEALDIDFGWAANGGSGTYDTADPDGLSNAGVWSGDAITDLLPAGYVYRPFHIVPGVVQFTEETTIQAEGNAAAAAHADFTIGVCVLYVMP